MSMSKPIPYQEYWAEVASLAKDDAEETTDPETATDFLRESMDGHQWVVYTFYNPQVLLHSAREESES